MSKGASRDFTAAEALLVRAAPHPDQRGWQVVQPEKQKAPDNRKRKQVQMLILIQAKKLAD
jgi:hypothetical protein